MAWFDTEGTASGTITYNTAGKQPAWINYMTNVNQTRGSFAELLLLLGFLYLYPIISFFIG